MFNIMDKVYNILAPVLLPLGVKIAAEEYINNEEELPAELVVYQKIDGYANEFANNMPIEIVHYVRVNYYTMDPKKKIERIELIKAAMIDGGFYYPTNDSIDIPREEGAVYWGIYSDFFYLQGAGEVT